MAAIISSVERGFLVALVVAVAVRLTPVVKPLVARTELEDAVAFKVFAVAFVLVVVVVVVVVVVLTVRGLYIDAKAFGRAVVVVVAGRLTVVVLGRDAKVEVLTLLRLAVLLKELALRVAVGRDALAKVGFNSGIVSDTGEVTIPGSRGAS